MAKYEAKQLNRTFVVFVGERRVTPLPLTEGQAELLADTFNNETAAFRFNAAQDADTIATQAAVIAAQSERIKELERVLRRIADNAPLNVREIETFSKDKLFNHTINYCISGKIALAALPLTESEANNGN